MIMAKKKAEKDTLPSAKARQGAAQKKRDPREAPLAEELRGLIPQLDAEGLAFLIEQARVHLYNMQVEKLNYAAEEADAASERANTIASRAGRSQAASKAQAGKLSIHGTESGSSFYLHYRNDEVMFSRDEMVHLIKIINAKGTDLEIRERLYNWFDRERGDVFAVVPIKNKFDDHLKALAALLKKSFKLRDS